MDLENPSVIAQPVEKTFQLMALMFKTRPSGTDKTVLLVVLAGAIDIRKTNLTKFKDIKYIEYNGLNKAFIRDSALLRQALGKASQTDFWKDKEIHAIKVHTVDSMQGNESEKIVCRVAVRNLRLQICW